MDTPHCGLQICAERLAAIEYKTIALIMRAADFLEIFEDAALKLVNAINTGFPHVDCSFFTADAASAK